MSGARYRVEFAKSARRGLNRAPEKIAAAAIEFCFGSLAANPHRVDKSLTHDLKGYRAARRGDYRVVYRIDEDARLVYVVRIEHRADVYRPRLPSPLTGSSEACHRTPTRSLVSASQATWASASSTSTSWPTLSRSPRHESKSRPATREPNPLMRDRSR